mgnify:CR=1 FL=1
MWRGVPDLGGSNLSAIRLWVRTEGVEALGVRIADSSGQCHQSRTQALVADGQWHEVLLRLPDLVGGEHWGGANDGKWHGPPTGLGLNVAKGSIGANATGTVWLAGIACVTTTAQRGTPTVLPCKLSQPSCRPGFGVDITYRWDAEPMDRDFTVFVHFLGPDGSMVLQDDHAPPGGTAIWSGPVEYRRTLVVPTNAPEGEYRVVLGLYDHAGAQRGWDHQVLGAAEGAQDPPDRRRLGARRVVCGSEEPAAGQRDPAVEVVRAVAGDPTTRRGRDPAPRVVSDGEERADLGLGLPTRRYAAPPHRSFRLLALSAARIRRRCRQRLNAGSRPAGTPASSYAGRPLYTSPSPRDRTRTRMPSSA